MITDGKHFTEDEYRLFILCREFVAWMYERPNLKRVYAKFVHVVELCNQDDEIGADKPMESVSKVILAWIVSSGKDDLIKHFFQNATDYIAMVLLCVEILEEDGLEELLRYAD